MMSDWWLNHASLPPFLPSFESASESFLPTFLHFNLIRITLAILSALSATSGGRTEGGREGGTSDFLTADVVAKKDLDDLSALPSQVAVVFHSLSPFALRWTSASADDMHERFVNYDHKWK